MNEKMTRQLNLIRAKHLQRRIRMDDDGYWVTTEGGNHIHISGEGRPDKGNPHVLEAMSGEKHATSESSTGTAKRSSSKIRKTPKYGGKMMTSFVNREGKTIDIGSNPLEYTNTKMQMPKTYDKTVRDFEKKCIDEKYDVEHMLLVDAYGNVIVETDGSAGMVGAPGVAYLMSDVTTHLHPRPNGTETLGGTFSVGDFEMWTDLGMYKPSIERVATNEGTYTFKAGLDFDIYDFTEEYRERSEKAEQRHLARRKRIENEVRNAANDAIEKWRLEGGESPTTVIDSLYAEANRKNAASFNRFLVEMHNELLDMQKDYDYEYYLEGWD